MDRNMTCVCRKSQCVIKIAANRGKGQHHKNVFFFKAKGCLFNEYLVICIKVAITIKSRNTRQTLQDSYGNGQDCKDNQGTSCKYDHMPCLSRVVNLKFTMKLQRSRY